MLKKRCSLISICILLIILNFYCLSFAQILPFNNPNIEIAFTEENFPQTLHTIMTGKESTPTLTYRLPVNYDPSVKYPLLVYVPGFDGGLKGNIKNAQTIADTNNWIVATVPLFKKTIDRDEPGGGIIISMEDFPVISKCYRIMFEKLFEIVPNIDYNKSTMVGFSNGAITLAVLLTMHDKFIIDHFNKFCLVDHGMFHLTDLHKQGSRNCQYLILIGDKQDLGRDLKIRQSKLLQDEMKLLGVNLTYEIMKDTGHEFNEKEMILVRKWIQNCQ